MEPNLPIPWFKQKKFLLIILILVIASVVVYLQYGNRLTKPLISQPTTKNNVLSPKRAMELKVKAAFNTTADKNIITFINLASTEENPIKAYQDYAKAYKLMVASYNELSTRSKEQGFEFLSKENKSSGGEQNNKKSALLSLKSYVSTLKEYKESDFVEIK